MDVSKHEPRYFNRLQDVGGCGSWQLSSTPASSSSDCQGWSAFESCTSHWDSWEYQELSCHLSLSAASFCLKSCIDFLRVCQATWSYEINLLFRLLLVHSNNACNMQNCWWWKDLWQLLWFWPKGGISQIHRQRYPSTWPEMITSHSHSGNEINGGQQLCLGFQVCILLSCLKIFFTA